MKLFKPHQFFLLGIFVFSTCQKPNTPPNADFTVNPSVGNTDSVFTFDASSCSDDQDNKSTLQVHWDWENDGNWDTDFSTHKIKEHQYYEPGNYIIILEVKDVEGLINSAEKTLYVSPSFPNVVTDSIVNINPYSAQGGGNVISQGSSQVTARGICWSTEENPSLEDEHSINGNGLGQFTAMLTNLSPNETYFVRAYVTSNVGTSYGNQVSFSTESTLSNIIIGNIIGIGSDYIEVSGNITSDGGLDITSKGICYSLEDNPDINDFNCIGGSGLGEFTCSLQGLLPYTNYYLKAYSTNSNGTSYSEQHIIRTKVAQPSVITNNISNITDNSATCGGQVTYDGGYSNTIRGICWSTTQNPDINDNLTTDGSGMGNYHSSITNLTHNTVYYVRAYATNPDYTVYGEQISFTTLPIVPTVTTSPITDITLNSAISGGNVTIDGGALVTSRGVCWSTTQIPDINDNVTIDGTGQGNFVSNISGLERYTTYYIRAYATNKVGTGYGLQLNFTTLGDGTFTDLRDGNIYEYVAIGSQIWMGNNLAYLPEVSSGSEGSDSDEYYYIHGYNGNSVSEAKAEDNYETYGVLYNWPAAMAGELSSNTNPSSVHGVCPDGWHLPSDAEWTELINYLGGEEIAGGKMKETGYTHWISPNTGATNESGFTGLPGGNRNDFHSSFREFGTGGYFWSATESSSPRVFTRKIGYSYTNMYRNSDTKPNGISVRCIKD